MAEQSFGMFDNCIYYVVFVLIMREEQGEEEERKMNKSEIFMFGFLEPDGG